MNLKIPKDRINAGQCYMNIFEVVLVNMDAFKNNLYKVCIGYVAYESNLNLLFRHAYIINNNGEVIYDSAREYLSKIPCEYNNVYVFEGMDYFNHIYENCIKGSNGHITLYSLQKITHDKDLQFVRENNIYEPMAGHDILIRNCAVVEN